MSQKYVTVKKEVKELRQRIAPKPGKDQWLIVNLTPVKTREEAQRAMKYGPKDDPEDMVEVLRVTTHEYPNPIHFRCKRKDVERKIREATNRES